MDETLSVLNNYVIDSPACQHVSDILRNDIIVVNEIDIIPGEQ